MQASITKDSIQNVKSRGEKELEALFNKVKKLTSSNTNIYSFLPLNNVANRDIKRGQVDGQPESPSYGYIGQLSGGVIGDDPLIPFSPVKDYKINSLNVLDLQFFSEGGQIQGIIPSSVSGVYNITADFSFDAYFNFSIIEQNLSGNSVLEITNLLLLNAGTVHVIYDPGLSVLSYSWTPNNQTIDLLNTINKTDFINTPTQITQVNLQKIINGDINLFGSIRMPSINVGSTTPYPILTSDESACIEYLFENKFVFLTSSLILKYGGNFANFTPKQTIQIN